MLLSDLIKQQCLHTGSELANLKKLEAAREETRVSYDYYRQKMSKLKKDDQKRYEGNLKK